MSKIRRVIVQIADDADLSALAERVCQVRADIIERRLKQSDLSAEQKIAAIDRMIDDLRKQERSRR